MSKYTHNRTDGSLKPIYSALEDGFNNLYKKGIISEEKNLQFIAIDHSNKLPNGLLNSINRLKNCNSNGHQIIRVLLGYDLKEDEKSAFKISNNYNDFKTNLLVPEIDLVIRTTEMRLSGDLYMPCLRRR